MKPRILTFLLAIALATPSLAAPGSVRDFQLPPAPTPTATPQVQGPVDTEGPVPVRPRVIQTGTPTPAPTPAATQSLPTPSDTPTTRSPAPQATPTPPRQTATPATTRSSQPAQTATPSSSSVPDELSAEPAADITASEIPDAALTDLSPKIEPKLSSASAEKPTAWPTWWLAILAAILALAGGLFFAWKRPKPAFAGVPEIAPPLSEIKPDTLANDTPVLAPVADPPAPTPPRAAKAKPIAPRVPVQLKARPVKLSRSLMNTTLFYKLEVRNLGTQPLREISIYADLVTAHASAPVGEQMANENSKLQFVEVIGEIAARDTQTITGEFQIASNTIRTISQGRAFLYVPLLRVRIDVEGKAPLVRTFVIGMLPQGGQGKLQPFRLDEIAQTYREIGVRQLG